MRMGKVVGSIWATRKAACLQGQTFLVVESEGQQIVAADQVGAGPGDRVLLATGTVASRYCMDAPVDAAVVAIETALLAESGIDRIVDKVIRVDAPLEIRIERAMLRDGSTRSQVLARMACQSEYPTPDIIINNV